MTSETTLKIRRDASQIVFFDEPVRIYKRGALVRVTKLARVGARFVHFGSR